MATVGSTPRSAPAGMTIGPTLSINKNTFVAVVVRVAACQQLSEAFDRVKSLPRLRHFQSFPCAARVCSSNNANGSTPAIHPEDSRESTTAGFLAPKPALWPMPAPSNPSEIVYESWEDDQQLGAGDRLLHLLQRWQVENILLVVARCDSSLSRRLIGPEVYKLVLEAAKLALENYYLESMKPSEAAKLELLENSMPNATPVQPQPTVCVMDTDTIPSWPKHHQPTSDGGGRKGVKQGRINHFMHRRESPRHAQSALKSPQSPSNNDVATASSPTNCDLAVDGSGSSSGIEWLGISRDEWLQLRAIRVPVKELHYLFMCLVVLLEAPPELKASKKAAPTPKMQEEFIPSDFSWQRCREILHQSTTWGPRLHLLRGSTLAKSQVTAIRAIFQEPSFTSEAFVRVSIASAKIFAWLQRLLDQYDEKDLGIIPNQQAEESVTVISTNPAVETPPSPGRKSPVMKKPSPPDAKIGEFDGLLSLSRPPKTPKIVDRGRLFGNSHSLSGSR